MVTPILVKTINANNFTPSKTSIKPSCLSFSVEDVEVDSYGEYLKELATRYVRHNKPLARGACGRVCPIIKIPTRNDAISINPLKKRVAKLQSPSPENADKAQSEAKILEILNKEKVPNIPKLFTRITEKDPKTSILKRQALIIERVKMDMRKHINGRKPLKLSDIRKHAKYYLEALSGMHKLRIGHLDLKPSNLSQTKLLDFGLARQIKERECTGFGGTLPYMAPEVAFGFSFDFTCDIWSIGCTLYELYTKKLLINVTNPKSRVHLLYLYSKKICMPPKKIFMQNNQGENAINKFLKKYKPLKTKNKTFKEDIKKSGAERNEQIEDLIQFIDLLSKMLKYNPKDRITAEDALQHSFFSFSSSPSTSALKKENSLSGKDKQETLHSSISTIESIDLSQEETTQHELFLSSNQKSTNQFMASPSSNQESTILHTTLLAPKLDQEKTLRSNTDPLVLKSLNPRQNSQIRVFPGGSLDATETHEEIPQAKRTHLNPPPFPINS